VLGIFRYFMGVFLSFISQVVSINKPFVC
jgi:hypothetical protein